MKTNVTKKQTIKGNATIPVSQSIKAEILSALFTVCHEDIKVTVMGSKVILDGAVESIQQKLTAETVVRKIPQIKEVENNLRVEWIC